mmetsp:Transcript_16512/g.33459  ORF Transcript_16512/g.33459 Transcript_16512/m.33459 type:complete len:160 (-) Transcript_16512:326-805(-)
MGGSDSSSDSTSSSSSDSSSDDKKKKKKKKSKKAKKEKSKKKDKKVRKKMDKKDPLDNWVVRNNKEEIAKKADKRRKREQKQAERERADAQAMAERMELQRRLFGAIAVQRGDVQHQQRQAFCPTRPEVGLMQMEEDEMAARMLCGTCKGGKQHSGANA